MGQNQLKPFDDQSSTGSHGSTAALIPPPPPPKDAPRNESLLEKNYAAYYSSDIYNDISAARSPRTPLRPTLDPTVAQLASRPPPPAQGITAPASRPQLLRVSDLIDPADLYSRSDTVPADFQDAAPSAGLNSPRPVSDQDRKKRLPALVESPSGNVFSAQEFAMHPKRPLAIRERQEGIKAALARAGLESEGRISMDDPLPPGAGQRKGSGGSDVSTDSVRTVDSGVSFGNSSGRNANLGTFEHSKIEEGRRSYEEKQAKKEKRKEDGKKGWLCFKS